MKKNILFVVIFVLNLFFAYSLQGTIVNIQDIAKPDLVVEVKLINQSSKVVLFTVKNGEFPKVRINKAFKVIIWDTKNNAHKYFKIINRNQINRNYGFNFSYRIPASWNTTQVGIKGDSDNVIAEKNENNNIAFANFVKPDLVVSAKVLNQNSNLVLFIVKNSEYPALRITKLFKVSIWNTKNSTQKYDRFVRSDHINRQNGYKFPFRIPSSWNSTQIGIKADSDNVIAEKNENNNIAYIRF
jgi:hypothetical protein